MTVAFSGYYTKLYNFMKVFDDFQCGNTQVMPGAPNNTTVGLPTGQQYAATSIVHGTKHLAST